LPLKKAPSNTTPTNAHKFYYYQHSSDDPTSIKGNFVERIYVAHNGGVWIGAEPAGFSKFNPETNRFFHVEGIEGQRVKDIVQDKNHLFWITTDLFLYSYDENQKKLTRYAYEKGIGLDRLLFTRQGNLLITTNEEFVLSFNPETQKFSRIYLMNDNERQNTRSTATYSAYLMTEDHEGYIWFTTYKGFLIRYNPATGEKKRYVFETTWENDNNKLTCMFIFEDSEYNLWLGTWFNGLYKFSADRQNIVQYLPDKNNPNSISNNIIHSGFEDKAGYLWFGTEFAGLNILKKTDKFSVIGHQKNNPYSLPPNEYSFGIKDDSNNFWVGSLGGGLLKSKVEKPLLFMPDKKFSRHFWVNTVWLDPSGDIWFGIDNLLVKHNPTRQTYKVYRHERDNYNSLTRGLITAIFRDKENILWIGTSGGLTRFDEKKQKFIRFVHDKDNPKSISNNLVRGITADKNNDIWVGTDDGLNKLNKESGNFSIFKQGYQQKNSIGGNQINDLCAIDDNIWIATFSGGISRYNLTDKKFSVYNTQNALPDNNVKGLESDRHGNLWITTKKNILKLDSQSLQFIKYDASDGLSHKMFVKNMGWQDLVFTSGFSFKDHDGYIYFGGVSGIVVFHPDSLPVNSYQPPVILESFYVNGKKQNLKQTKYQLSNKQNHFKFDLSVLNYIQPEKNQFAYKLEPYDTAWHYAGHQNSVEYYNLPPQKYTFLYKGANNDGVWSPVFRFSPIVIQKAFYQSSWFYLSIGVFFLLILGLFGLYRIYLKRKLSKQKQKLRYYSSNLKPSDAQRINEKLKKIFSEKKPHLEHDLSLHRLAEIISEKPHYVSQVINQLHHKRFHDYINTFRIEEAKKLLRETYLKIEAVAYDSGFNSISTFNAVFKKETGMTPSKFRKLHSVKY